MKRIKGRILHNGAVVAEDVDISLIHIPPTPDVFGKWYGTHNASGLFDIDNCILELEDGRKGDIIITGDNEFKGTGPLN